MHFASGERERERGHTKENFTPCIDTTFLFVFLDCHGSWYVKIKLAKKFVSKSIMIGDSRKVEEKISS